ncbi:MAG: Wzz/FepE/Etk N-terminal domain-containing protein, partial [Candidatus Korobacteraceae bacterium]
MRQLTPGTSLAQRPEDPHVYAFPLPSGDPGDPLSEVSLHQYIRVLVKQRWVILATVVIISAIAVIATYRMVPIYEAAGKIVVNQQQNVLPFSDGSQAVYAGDDSLTLETQARILQSDALGLEVVKRLSPQQRAMLLKRPAAPAGPVTSLADQEKEY